MTTRVYVVINIDQMKTAKAFQDPMLAIQYATSQIPELHIRTVLTDNGDVDDYKFFALDGNNFYSKPLGQDHLRKSFRILKQDLHQVGFLTIGNYRVIYTTLE